MTEISQLQKFIDTNINDVTGPCYSFICNALAGDCIIPEDVCIRFVKSDEITGIQAIGNNVLNFDNSTLGVGKTYNFKNSAININNCTIRNKLVFDNCKLYISNCNNITGQIYLTNNSYCKSHKNTFTTGGEEKTSISVIKNSKFESYIDKFYNFDGPVFSLSDHSFIKLSDPEISAVGQLVLIDNYSKFEIYTLTSFVGREGSPLARVTNNSTLKIHKIPTLNIRATAIYLDKSFCYLNDLGPIVTTESFIKAVDSTIEINKASDIRSTGLPYTFDCVNSNINIYDITKLVATSGCFNFKDSKLVYVNSNNLGTELTAITESIIKSTSTGINNAKFYLDTIDKIKATGVAFDINGSSLSVTNISNITSSDNLVSSNKDNYGKIASKIIFSNIETLNSTNSIIYGDISTKAFINNVNNISSRTDAFFINKGALYLQYIDNLSSPTNSINVQESSCSVFDIGNIGGNVVIARGNTTPTISINNCKLIDGDVLIDFTITDISNVTIKKDLKITESTVNLNNVIVEGKFNTNSSVITNTNCKFLTEFTSVSSVVNNIKTPLNELTTIRNSSIINSLSPTTNNVSLTDSSLLNLTSPVGGLIDIIGSSTILALNSIGDVHTMNEGIFTKLNAAFISGSGTLGIAANDALIDIRSLAMKETVRTSIDISALTKYTLSVDGKSTITIDPSKIEFKSAVVHAITS
jgi:hypothetical protein